MEHNTLCPGCFTDSSGQEPCPNCGYEDKAEEATLYLPPRSILAEKYLIGRVLGQGGFGITYLGWDMNLDMKLAVKEFFPQGLVSRLPGQCKVISLAGIEAHQFGYWQERFLQEAKTLAQFEHHPNIVSVRDFFKANGTAYMIMSYVEGLTLDQHLAQAGGNLPYDKAIEVMMPVMDALREVHEVGVIHRDISPDNIFIDNKGRVVLIDFGAARHEISDKSKSLSVILKAGYAPEEQYRSRGKQGPWTDIYAVGATLYRAITGHTPPEAMDRLDEDDLVPPSQLDVAIKPNQEQALLKALAVKAKDRYQAVEEFQRALVAVRDEGLAPQVAPTYSVSKRTVKIAALALLGGLLIFGAVSLFGSGDEAVQTSELPVIAGLETEYYIDYENGSISLGDLSIGARVFDPSWEWEFRTGNNYSDSGEVKPVTWFVVAKDHYDVPEPHVTLLSEELIGKHLFSEERTNHWGDSELRTWLNSATFQQAFSEKFKQAIVAQTLPNREWQNGTAYSTQDYVFIPSTTELGDTDHKQTYQLGSTYPYFQGVDDSTRITSLDGEIWWYWTRSPASYSSSFVRDVSSSGAFHEDSVYNVGYGVRPALNLKAETMVSEIKN